MTNRGVLSTNDQRPETSGKKGPIRTCLGCRQERDKDQLIRIVKVKDDGINIDLSGRSPGRGAYICPSVDCINKALSKSNLEKALKTDISGREKEKIKRVILNDMKVE